ncbi:substrate-binding periplasmic protein [Dongshaea marina]|uniref:substrate-binding periplasmic protein n=1 Tax=Dongshaea marina TaxID=2047966 RepID=UPI00131F133B|nr:ABC transporter substrate-binding protein [Dongshaea marina]
MFGLLSMLLPGQSQEVMAQILVQGERDFSKLIYVTEDYPPGNFLEEGELKGIGVDLLLAAANEAGYSIKRSQIQLNAWARSYRMALKVPGYVVFSTTRTPEREALFKWAGPIQSGFSVGLIAHKDSQIQINSLAEIKKYRIAVIRGDVADELLIQAGVAPQQLVRNKNPRLLALQLSQKRVDLWAFEPDSAKEVLRSIKASPEDFEQVFRLADNTVYYALNRQTPDSLVQSLQQAIDRVKQTPQYQEIIQRYIKQP